MIGVAPSTARSRTSSPRMRVRARRRRDARRGSRGSPPTTRATYPNNVSILEAVGRGEVAMGLVNHYYDFRAKQEDPDLPTALHFFADGDLGGAAAGHRGQRARQRRPAGRRRAAASSSCSRRRPRGTSARRRWSTRWPPASSPPRGCRPLDVVARARIDFGDARRPRTHGRADRRERPQRLTRGAADGVAPSPTRPLLGPSCCRRRSVALPFAAPLVYLVIEVAQHRRATPSTSSRPVAALEPLGRTAPAGDVGRRPRPPSSAPAWRGSPPGPTCRSGGCGRSSPPLPLVFPSFVGAAALLAAVAPGGLLDELLPGGGQSRLPTVEGFGGAFAVLTLFTYPYVYLPVAARLASLPPVARGVGPAAGPAPVGGVPHGRAAPDQRAPSGPGTLLVFLYTVSDFGAVAQLRYRHPDRRHLRVTAVRPRPRPRRSACSWRSWRSRSSPPSGPSPAAAAVLEVAARPARRCGSRSGGGVGPRWWPSRSLLGNALLGPARRCSCWWAWRGFTGRRPLLGAADVGALVEPTASTALLGVGTAVVTVALVLPVAYLTSRYRSRGGRCRQRGRGRRLRPARAVGGACPRVLDARGTLRRRALPDAADADGGLRRALRRAGDAGRPGGGGVGAAAGSTTPPACSAPAAGGGLATIELPLMLPGLLAGARARAAVDDEGAAGHAPAAADVARHSRRCASGTPARRPAGPRPGLSALVLVLLSGVLTWVLVVRRIERFD